MAQERMKSTHDSHVACHDVRVMSHETGTCEWSHSYDESDVAHDSWWQPFVGTLGEILRFFW